jgi:predicted membrane channel-forming protein YqfA (hemolysin III family)
VKGTSAVFTQFPISVNFEKAISKEVKVLFAKRDFKSENSSSVASSFSLIAISSNSNTYKIGYGVMVLVAMIGIWGAFMKLFPTPEHAHIV